MVSMYTQQSTAMTHEVGISPHQQGTIYLVFNQAGPCASRPSIQGSISFSWSLSILTYVNM